MVFSHSNGRRSGSVLIRGDGVAAYCCGHLLRKAGFKVALDRLDRARIPAIMLGHQSLSLMRDVFEKPALFSHLPVIQQRIVSWGQAAASRLPHSAVVVSENFLLSSLGCELETSATLEADFTIHTIGPIAPGVSEKPFGARRAAAARVSLKQDADRASCWIESLTEGWLFLIPNAQESTWLLGIGAPLQSLLGASRLIAPLIDASTGRSAEFPSCPRILTPLYGNNWLACGSVAMGFDPICGDGTAQAIREAILSAAVIRAIFDGGDRAALLSHYEMMLTASMRRHLALCAEFYRTGGTGHWWQTELESLVDGHAWCTARLAHAPEPQYQLHDFDLLKREFVAQ